MSRACFRGGAAQALPACVFALVVAAAASDSAAFADDSGPAAVSLKTSQACLLVDAKGRVALEPNDPACPAPAPFQTPLWLITLAEGTDAFRPGPSLTTSTGGAAADHAALRTACGCSTTAFVTARQTFRHSARSDHHGRRRRIPIWRNDRQQLQGPDRHRMEVSDLPGNRGTARSPEQRRLRPCSGRTGWDAASPRWSRSARVGHSRIPAAEARCSGWRSPTATPGSTLAATTRRAVRRRSRRRTRGVPATTCRSQHHPVLRARRAMARADDGRDALCRSVVCGRKALSRVGRARGSIR